MITQKKTGYYDVRVHGNGTDAVYRVLANSDYAAAVTVRRATGLMPASEREVEFLPALSSVFGSRFEFLPG